MTLEEGEVGGAVTPGMRKVAHRKLGNDSRGGSASTSFNRGLIGGR